MSLFKVTKQKYATRQGYVCPIFGYLTDLNELRLPTKGDVMKYFLFVRHELRSASEKEPTVSEISEKVEDRLENLWVRASIPSLSRQRINSKIRDLHQEYRNIMKSFKRGQKNDIFQKKLKAYVDNSEKIPTI